MTKLKTATATAGITMKTINKSTLAVSNTSSTTMSSSSTENICFSLSFLPTSFTTYKRIKLRFTQVGNSTETVYLSTSTSGYLLTGTLYPTTILQDETYTYREVDLTDVLVNAGGETLYFAFNASTSTSISLYTNNASSSLKPRIVTEYVSDSDFLNNQKNLTGSINGNDEYNVNVRSGKLSYTINLFETESEHLPTKLCLTYSTEKINGSLVNGFPIGWRLNYNQQVTSSKIYYDGNSKKHTFVNSGKTIDSKQVYYESEGNYLVMYVDTSSSDSYYEINNSRGTRLIFNSSGLLRKIINEVSSTKEYSVLVEYDSSNRISKIIDGSAKETTISYDTTNYKIVITKPNTSNVLQINFLINMFFLLVLPPNN